MKLFTQVIAGAGALLLATSAQAVGINGEISFAGSFMGNARTFAVTSEFNSLSDLQITDAAGDFDVADPTSVNWPGFRFADFTGPVHWQFLHGGDLYKFEMTSAEVIERNRTRIGLVGSGMAYITGYDETPGTWTLMARDDRTFTATFTARSQSVPDGGATLGLLGFAVVCLGLLRKTARHSA